MKNPDCIRERYLRDALPVRIGGLAANLCRIKSFSTEDVNRDLVKSVIHESKFFIEWTAAEAEMDVAAELVDLQVQLARWQQNWDEIWVDVSKRQAVAEQAGAWSQRVLEMSGLLNIVERA